MPNVAMDKSDSYLRVLVLMKMESVNILTSVSKSKVLIFESYVPVWLSIICPSLSLMAPPLKKTATLSFVL